MSDPDVKKMQEIEIKKLYPDIVDDLRELIEKYRSIMAWNVPENDPVYADKLIFDALKRAFEEVEDDCKFNIEPCDD